MANKITKVVSLIFVGIISLLCVVPFVVLIVGTLTGNSELASGLAPVLGESEGYASLNLIPLYPTFKNIIDIFMDSPEVYIMFWNSFKIVGIIILGHLIFAVPAAWALARTRKRWGRVMFGLYMFCMILPFQVTMLSQYIVLDKLSILNTIWSVSLPIVFSTFPVFVIYSSFESIPQSVIEAAKIDGAGRLVTYAFIAVPIAKNGIVSAVLLTFFEYWNMVEQPVVFLKDKLLWPMSVYIPSFESDNLGRTFAFAAFSCIPLIVMFMVGKDILLDGISIGASED